MIKRGIDELVAERASGLRPYLEFCRSNALSVGVYVLAAGAVDLQLPHREEEVYVVLRGRGRFTAENETTDVAAGDVIYVPSTATHRFHDIVDELALIVVFAPPES